MKLLSRVRMASRGGWAGSVERLGRELKRRFGGKMGGRRPLHRWVLGRGERSRVGV